MLKSTAHADQHDATALLVAANLTQYMDERRWTGRSFALAHGFTPIYVQRRMSGEVEMSATDLKVFADHLGIKVQDLYKPQGKTKAPSGSNRPGPRALYGPDETYRLTADCSAIELQGNEYSDYHEGKEAPGELIRVDFGARKAVS